MPFAISLHVRSARYAGRPRRAALRSSCPSWPSWFSTASGCRGTLWDRALSCRRRRVRQEPRAVGVPGDAVDDPRFADRTHLVVPERVRVRPPEHAGIGPRERDDEMLAIRRQLVSLAQVRARASKPAAGNRRDAALVEADGVDEQRLAVPAADRMPVGRPLELLGVRMLAAVDVDVAR